MGDSATGSSTLPPPAEFAAGHPPQSILYELLEQQSQVSAVDAFSEAHADLSGSAQQEPAQSRYYKALLPATPPAPGQQYAFEVDLDACSGCKACVVACHSLNGLEDAESWRSVGTLTIGEDSTSRCELPQVKHVTTACHHCAEPGCLSGCPVAAYDKDPVTGIVKHLDDQCIGCKYCTMMCPYEVPKYSERLGIVRKCDMCHQRLSVGEAPACVQSCPNQAITIRLRDTAELAFSATDRLSAGAPRSEITRPSTSYTTAEPVGPDAFLHAQPQDAGIYSPAESHWPLAVMLVLTQASVGVVAMTQCAVVASWLLDGSALPVKVTLGMLLVGLMLGGLGLGIASLHLGQPLRAWRVFLGLRTSWLSREAVVFGKYMGLVAATALLFAWQQFPASAPTLLLPWIPAWAASLGLAGATAMGLLGVFSSGMIYVVTRRQLWSLPRTMLRFAGSLVVLGPWVFGAVVALGLSLDGTQLSFSLELLLGGLLASVMALSAFKLAWEWRVLLGGGRPTDSAYDSSSRQLVRNALNGWRWTRLALGAAAVLLGAGSAAALLLGQIEAGVGLAVISLPMALAGEILERLLYFSSVVYDRMPGALR